MPTALSNRIPSQIPSKVPGFVPMLAKSSSLGGVVADLINPRRLPGRSDWRHQLCNKYPAQLWVKDKRA